MFRNRSNESIMDSPEDIHHVFFCEHLCNGEIHSNVLSAKLVEADREQSNLCQICVIRHLPIICKINGE